MSDVQETINYISPVPFPPPFVRNLLLFSFLRWPRLDRSSVTFLRILHINVSSSLQSEMRCARYFMYTLQTLHRQNLENAVVWCLPLAKAIFTLRLLTIWDQLPTLSLPILAEKIWQSRTYVLACCQFERVWQHQITATTYVVAMTKCRKVADDLAMYQLQNGEVPNYWNK